MKREVFFRADGNCQMGLGHVIRSLALADMINNEYQCHFIIRNPIASLKEQILEICDSMIRIDDSIEKENEAVFIRDKYIQKDNIVVLDGYHFDTEYQRLFKTAGCKIVCIDDIHKYHFLADAVINHAEGVIKDKYSTESYTQFFLGFKYALLRRAFIENKRIEQYPERNKSWIFCCLGGADPKNNTLDVLKTIEQDPAIDSCYLVIGAAYQYREELEVFLKNTSLSMRLMNNLSADEMSSCMRKCGKAVTSLSTVALEYLSIGGELYLKMIANNQIDVFKNLIDLGLAYDFDAFPVSGELVEKSISLQSEYFDGKQKKRYKKLFKFINLDSRRASTEDRMIFFNWANEKETRAQSFNSDPIPYEDHVRWFDNKLNDNKSAIYIITYNKEDIGQVRFDIEKDCAIISYSIDQKFRNQGWSSPLLQRGVAQFKKDHQNSYLIIGFVKKENIASSIAFRNLGFRESIATEYEHSFKYEM